MDELGIHQGEWVEVQGTLAENSSGEAEVVLAHAGPRPHVHSGHRVRRCRPGFVRIYSPRLSRRVCVARLP